MEQLSGGKLAKQPPADPDAVPMLLGTPARVVTHLPSDLVGTWREFGGNRNDRYPPFASGATVVDGVTQKVTPAPYVMGLASIGGRPVAVGGEDFSVRGGMNWGDRSKGGQGGFSGDLAWDFSLTPRRF